MKYLKTMLLVAIAAISVGDVFGGWKGSPSPTKKTSVSGSILVENPNNNINNRTEQVTSSNLVSYCNDVIYIITHNKANNLNLNGQAIFDPSAPGETDEPTFEFLVKADSLAPAATTSAGWLAIKRLLTKCINGTTTNRKTNDLKEILKLGIGGDSDALTLENLYKKYGLIKVQMYNWPRVGSVQSIPTSPSKDTTAVKNPNDTINKRIDNLNAGNLVQSCYDVLFVLTDGRVTDQAVFKSSGKGETDDGTLTFLVNANKLVTTITSPQGRAVKELLSKCKSGKSADGETIGLENILQKGWGIGEKKDVQTLINLYTRYGLITVEKTTWFSAGQVQKTPALFKSKSITENPHNALLDRTENLNPGNLVQSCYDIVYILTNGIMSREAQATFDSGGTGETDEQTLAFLEKANGFNPTSNSVGWFAIKQLLEKCKNGKSKDGKTFSLENILRKGWGTGEEEQVARLKALYNKYGVTTITY